MKIRRIGKAVKRPAMICIMVISSILLTGLPVMSGEGMELVADNKLDDLYNIELNFKTAGELDIVNGRLKAEAKGVNSNASIKTLETYKDLIAEFEVTFNNKKNVLSISARSIKEKETYAFYIYPHGILLIRAVIYKPSLEKVELDRFRVPLTEGIPYKVKVKVIGNELALKIWEKRDKEPRGWLLTAQDETIQKPGVFAIEVMRDAVRGGNYSAELANIKIWVPNVDMSYYKDKLALIGYPSLISKSDQKRIFSYRNTTEDLKHNLRMVGWTYDDVTQKEAEAIVKKLKESGVNTVISAGNRVLFRNLGANIKNSSIIADACHKYGMKFIHHLTTTLVFDDYVKKYPEHASVDIIFDKPVFSTYKKYVTCFNNDDFWKGYMRRLEELFKNVDMDGIMIDEIQFWGDYTCGCRYCREKFKKETGYEIPYGRDKTFFRNVKNPVYIVWLEWRKNKIEERNLEVRALMKKYMPGGGFYPTYLCNPSVAGRWNAYYRVGMALDNELAYTSALGNEAEPINFKYFYEWPYILPEMKYLKAANSRLDADPWLYYYPGEYGDYTWCWFFAMSMGTTMWFPGEHQPNELIESCRRPIIQWSAKYQDILGNTKPFANTGVLFSLNTRDLSTDGVEWRRGYMGICQAFTDAHISYKVLIDRDMKKDVLEGLQTLVLFNTVNLSDEAVGAIRNFVKSGGTLIASGSMSRCDERGNVRPDFGLSDLFGFSYGNRVKSNKNSLNIPEENELTLDFIGEWPHDESFIELKDIVPGCKVVGEMVNADGKRYPGIIIRNCGKGKIVYFSGHPELKYLNQDHLRPNRLPVGKYWKDKRDRNFFKIVKYTVNYGNKEPSLIVENVPRGVVAEAYEQKSGDLEGIVVHLANFAGSDLKEGIIPKMFNIHFPDLRKNRPAPDKDISVLVKTDNIKKVYLVSPDFADTVEMKHEKTGNYVSVQLPVFYRYAILYFVREGEETILKITNGKTVRKIPRPVKLITKNQPSLAGKYDPENIVFFADDPKIEGGYFNVGRSIGCVRRLYGARSKYSKMKVRFNIEKEIEKGNLEIGAMERAVKGKVPVEIRINDKVIFEGENPFPAKKAGVVKLKIKKDDIKIGENIIEIRNTADSESNSRPPLISVSFIKIIPVYTQEK